MADLCEDGPMPDRLSGLDTSFLHLERAGAHMHVASVSIFGGPAPTHGEFRDHIASRLHLVPLKNIAVLEWRRWIAVRARLRDGRRQLQTTNR